MLVEGLTCRFGTKAAADDASFSIEPGSFVGVIGLPGAAGVDAAADDQPPRRLSRKAASCSKASTLTALRGRDLRQWRARSAMIFQQFNLVGRPVTLTNALMGGSAGHSILAPPTVPASRKTRHRRVSALEQFEPIAAQRADQLLPVASSSASRSRGAGPEPDIILADEPIGFADPRNTTVMDALLRITGHFGITVICTLHLPDLARTYCVTA